MIAIRVHQSDTDAPLPLLPDGTNLGLKEFFVGFGGF